MKKQGLQNIKNANKSFASVTILAALILISLIGAGCLGQETDNNVVVSGSTSILPLAQSLSEKYMEIHNETVISVKGGGSGTGIAELIDGSNDIAMASRKIKDTEVTNAQANGINPVEHMIAKDGIAVIVHPANPVKNLTLEQLQKIYSGEIRNWSEVGGNDEEIAAIARDSSSGTQEFFTEAVMGDVELRSDLITQSATGAVTQEVMQNQKAIGFINAAYQNANLKTIGLDVNGTVFMPTEENVLSEKYPLSRGLYLYTDANVKEQADEFIQYIFSTEGQKIIREMGYTAVQ